MIEQKFDEAPDQKFIELMNDSFLSSPASKAVSMNGWAKDKSSDFYLGMMAAVGIAIQAAQLMIETSAAPEAIVNELTLFNGQLATIVKEKESKIILV